MPDQFHVFVSGLVQGVGFRHGVYRQALKLGLRGWVRNLADGRVEAVAQGDRPVLDQLLVWCHRGPAVARVDGVVVTWETVDPSLAAFEIRF